jgi:hypothetical protein
VIVELDFCVRGLPVLFGVLDFVRGGASCLRLGWDAGRDIIARIAEVLSSAFSQASNAKAVTAPP